MGTIATSQSRIHDCDKGAEDSQLQRVSEAEDEEPAADLPSQPLLPRQHLPLLHLLGAPARWCHLKASHRPAGSAERCAEGGGDVATGPESDAYGEHTRHRGQGGGRRVEHLLLLQPARAGQHHHQSQARPKACLAPPADWLPLCHQPISPSLGNPPLPAPALASWLPLRDGLLGTPDLPVQTPAPGAGFPDLSCPKGGGEKGVWVICLGTLCPILKQTECSWSASQWKSNFLCQFILCQNMP